MASQSLYRKWRSQTFSDLVGQEPVIRTLKNALNGGTLAHAYLFTGPRGTGKTSTARLLAKTVNCPNAKDGEPCNTCEQCREITAGNSFNVIEIDAASNRGIDSIRDLREKVMMPPTTGKYKVYILDEAHMLTNEAFNALLKTLEEPPPHAIFVMATTDVHKMLPTVLSRCQRFDFKRITTQQIVDHLNFVAGQEHVDLERSAAELIARAAAGGMRDALSLLDQAIAYAGEHVTLAQVQTMLGVADPRAIQKFILHIAQLDSAGGLHLINELVEAGADLRQVNNQVAEFWRAMMLARAGADIATIIDGTQDEVSEIQQTAQLFVLEELTECARIFAQNELVQKSQGTPQLGLELGLLNAIALHRRGGQPVVTQPAPVASAPSRAAPRPEPVRAPVAPVSVPNPTPQQEISASTPPPSVPREAAKSTEESPEWDDLSYTDDDEAFEPTATPQATSMPSVPASDVAPEQAGDAAPTLMLEDVKESWESVMRRVKTRKDGAKIAALLKGYRVVRVEEAGGVPIVVIIANATFHYTALQKKDDQDSLEWALKIELKRDCRVRLLPPGSSGVGSLSPVIPPPATPPSASNRVANSNRAASAAPSSAPQSAHLERPVAQSSAPSLKIVPPRQDSQGDPPPRKQETQRDAPTSEQKPSLTLVKKAVVRENTETIGASIEEDATLPRPQESGATRQEVAAKKVKHDPVVQEVVRMFKANIKDVHLK